MPLAHARRFRVALWIALLVLLIPVSLTFGEFGADGIRPWLRLTSLIVVAATLVAALSRQRSLEARVRSQQAADEAVDLRLLAVDEIPISGRAENWISSLPEGRRS